MSSEGVARSSELDDLRIAQETASKHEVVTTNLRPLNDVLFAMSDGRKEEKANSAQGRVDASVHRGDVLVDLDLV